MNWVILVGACHCYNFVLLWWMFFAYKIFEWPMEKSIMLKGDVAQACRQTQTLLAPPSPLMIKDVFSALQKIRYG